MARFKTTAKKLRLVKANNQSKAIPSWIMVKTKGRVKTSPHRRNWRRSKLDI